ncbi:MAG: ribosome maturation factor RimM [Thermodesulfobacteriota bacterium]
MPIKTRDLVLLGEVTKPHGIRGEVCVKSHADSPDVFLRVSPLYLARPGEKPRPVRLQGLREHKSSILARFAGVEDRNAAEDLRGCRVLAQAADLPALAADEVYLHQVEGLAVLLPDGSRLGVVEAADASSGQELWLIRSESGREVLLPAAFVTGLDLDAGAAVADPPPGLLDLYLGD